MGGGFGCCVSSQALYFVLSMSGLLVTVCHNNLGSGKEEVELLYTTTSSLLLCVVADGAI